MPERRKQYRPKHKQKSFYIYEKDDIEFKIALVGLKEIYNGYLVLFNGKKQRTFKHVLLKIEKNNIMAKGNDK